LGFLSKGGTGVEFLERFVQSLTAALVSVGLLNFLTALLILIVGYLVAKLIERAVAGLLKRTDVDNRLARATGGGPATTVSVEEGAARFVFYILMLFVLAAVFQRLNLTVITVPLNRLLTQIVAFIPRLIGAGIIFAVGYMLATILRRLHQYYGPLRH
jgi:hypothetical protein